MAKVNKWSIYSVLISLIIFPFAIAFADPGQGPKCDHIFYVQGCNYPELNGQDGQDGQDGEDGKDGKDGRDGVDGVDGKDGVVPTEWYDTMLRYSDYALASSVIDFTTPVYENNRAAVTVTQFGGRRAMGMSYARRFGNKENTLLSVGFGSAGGEQVFKAQLGWEF